LAVLQAFGWPALFQIYGSLGLLWMFGWQRLVSDPQQEQWQQQQQQQHELQGLAVPQQQVLAPAATAAAAAGQQRQPPLGMAAGQASSSGLQEHQALSYSQRPMKFAELPWRQFFTNRPFLGLLVTHSMFGGWHDSVLLGALLDYCCFVGAHAFNNAICCSRTLQ
jgi:hypothetical protein